MVDSKGVQISNPDLKFEKDSTVRLLGGPFDARKTILLELSHLSLKNALFHRILLGGFILLALIMFLFSWMPSQKPSQEQSYLAIIAELKKLKTAFEQGKLDIEAFKQEEQRLREVAYILIQKQNGTVIQ